jgi:hypothetical protein
LKFSIFLFEKIKEDKIIRKYFCPHLILTPPNPTPPHPTPLGMGMGIVMMTRKAVENFYAKKHKKVFEMLYLLSMKKNEIKRKNKRFFLTFSILKNEKNVMRHLF